MSIEFKLEVVDDLFEELKPLLKLHWREIAHYQDINLDPDWDFYSKAQATNCLRAYTARKEGKLIGYSLFFIKANAHYKDSLQAAQDILFIHPEHRGSLGAKLIRWCDAQLQAEGVQVVYHHVKKAHNFGPLLERMGYQLVDLIYGRRLDK